MKSGSWGTTEAETGGSGSAGGLHGMINPSWHYGEAAGWMLQGGAHIFIVAHYSLMFRSVILKCDLPWFPGLPLSSACMRRATC